LIRLSNGLLIRLIGVRENKALNGLAVNFITEKTKGQKVFLKFDSQKYDNENRLLCYIYLKNKTFLNAHLIKEGLVEVDCSIDFKYKDKFTKLGARHG
jgi:site-specific DNA-methyltransferase (adenine-specific)